MRVLIVSQYFWPENFRINDLATDLANKGHQVTVLTGFPNYPDGYVFEDFKKNRNSFNELNGVEIVRVPVVSRGTNSLTLILNYFSFALMASILGLWRLRGRAIDVVFVNQLSPVFVGIPGALIASLEKAPMLMWVLDLWPETLQAIGVIRSPKLLALVGKLVSLIYGRCDLVLSQSRSFIPKIIKSSPKDLRVEYLPSWAEEIFNQQFVDNATEIPFKENSFDILFAGNIGVAQDFPCILAAAEALKNHSNIRWLIVGDGRMRSWLEQEIKLRGLSGQVLLLGKFHISRMPSFYQAANALLVTLQDKPIFDMTIPGKLQSYLTAGRPVIAALNGEGATIIKESGAGYVSDAGDYMGLANNILKISSLNNSELDVLGDNGILYSKKFFNRRVVIDKIENYFYELNCLNNGVMKI